MFRRMVLSVAPDGCAVAPRSIAAAAGPKVAFLYADLPVVSFVAEPDGCIAGATGFAAERLGYEAGQIEGMSLLEFYPESEHPRIARELAACRAQPGTPRHWSGCTLHREGYCLHFDTTVCASADADGRPALLVVCSDATRAQALSEKLTRRESHDSLTDLPNRAAFERRLMVALGERDEHAVLWIDVDQFEIVNQTFGHRAGDELLRELVDLLRRRLRKSDFLARVGGDSFGLLIENCGLSQALRVAQLLEEAIEGFRFQWKDGVHRVRASVGLVPVGRDGPKAAAEVLCAASSACHVAKESGTGRVQVHHACDAGVQRYSRDMEWVARIERALDQHRFVLCTQPIQAMQGTAGGQRYEVLLRMRGDGGELIPPGHFLPTAERYHLATRIDRWVVREVLAWLESTPEVLAKLELCFVNLSGRSLGDEEFLATVIADLERSAVPASKLCFEVTETAAIANLALADRFCRTLRALGCRFALDDFGSGVSSFAYLRSLPVDFLKIDGMFVRDVIDDPVALATVRSINEIGQLMGKQTIAEFVESEAILEIVRDIGLDFGQGFSIGKPHRWTT